MGCNCVLFHLFKPSLSGFHRLPMTFCHFTNRFFLIQHLLSQLLNFFVRCFYQLWVARILCSDEVVGIAEVLHLGSLLRWRKILRDKLVDCLRRCLGAIPCFTIEHEDAVFRYFRNTLNVLSALTFAQCLVVPLWCVIQVKSSFLLIGVDFVAEREDDDNIGRLARRYGVLENRQTVSIWSSRSDALFENEHGQVNSYITVLFNPFIIDCLPFVCRHVGVVETWSVNQVKVFEWEHFGLVSAPLRLVSSLELLLRHSTHFV